MPEPFHDTLGQLTGEQIMHLIKHLDIAMGVCQFRIHNGAVTEPQLSDLADVYEDLAELHQDAMLNIARIQVPMVEAQAIIWRTVFARRRPFRVNPT